jgi:hypothetical protein
MHPMDFEPMILPSRLRGEEVPFELELIGLNLGITIYKDE